MSRPVPPPQRPPIRPKQLPITARQRLAGLESRTRLAVRLKEILDSGKMTLVAIHEATGISLNTIRAAANNNKKTHAATIARLEDFLNSGSKQSFQESRLSSEDLEMALAYHMRQPMLETTWRTW